MHVQLDLTQGNYIELSAVCALLSRLWNQELDVQTLQRLEKPEVAETWTALGGSLPDHDDATLELLAVDYCQLLVGPRGHISPVQSIWSAGRFAADSAGTMQQYVEMLKGFQPCNKITDHVAVQLQYLGVVLGIAAESKKDLWQGLATRFAAQHLAWTHEFFEQVAQRANSDFYRGLATVSQRFLFE